MTDVNNIDNNEELALDDANRVQVLSPGMMVAKRFFRNKLAITGLVIIICMFLFSFLGGMVIPYSQSKVFYTSEEMKKDYAGATLISEYQLFAADGVELPSDINSKLILALTKGEDVIETRDGSKFSLEQMDENSYEIKAVNGAETMAVAAKLQIVPVDADTKLSGSFNVNLIKALATDDTMFASDDTRYSIDSQGNGAIVTDSDGNEVAYISAYSINAVESGVTLSIDFRDAIVDAINDGVDSFTFNGEDGEEEYQISNKNGQYTITKYKATSVINQFESPSLKHILGTDGNGMDLLARLMYGGRISLLIGFVVVAIELVLGIIIGGTAGFFGGWVDNILMRFVDIIYCIPTMPLYLIIGSIMDFYKIDAGIRIFYLCIIMGAIGWVSLARIVRGQILSLREQEFMTACEALGISIRRRIFRHLIPNVIPQLVVFASMGVGEVILAESTLSYLGLGVKYPAASWGNIINAVTDSYVMTNYWFVWIPAGVLILLTVLAFNFIGDGLRDAFDPKMKR